MYKVITVWYDGAYQTAQRLQMPKNSGKREKTASFICELPLKATQQQEVVLLTRLEAGRQLYNACLGEAMRRLNLIKESAYYQKARTLKRDNPQRKVLFKKARERWNFSDYSIQAYATQIRHSWISDHIDTHANPPYPPSSEGGQKLLRLTVPSVSSITILPLKNQRGDF